MAAKADTAECREAALEIVHADFNEDMQVDIKTNHDRKSVTCVRNLDAGQLDILTMNDDRYLVSSAGSLERYLIES
jgi:translation initiation factor 1 (eIF-1/SUI1)